MGNRVIKFALGKSIGKYIKKEPLLEQFNVEISKGKVELYDIELSIAALNELLLDLPLRVTNGFIKKIVMQVPWTSLWNDSLTFEFHGLELEIECNNSLLMEDLNLSKLFEKKEKEEEDEEGRDENKYVINNLENEKEEEMENEKEKEIKNNYDDIY